MMVLGLDPGQESPGYAVFDSDAGQHIYVGSDPPPRGLLNGLTALVVESGYIGRMGLKSMWGLGFCAGAQLSYQFARCAYQIGYTPPCFTIRPDGKLGWRAALPDRPGFKQFDGLPKDVIVARLRVRYGEPDERFTSDDMIEAMGIAEAAAAILARPKAAQRRALKAVKF